jgi:phosphohistidine phosphatase
MRIILFRHGPAGKRDEERWPDDGLRPLTARGIERTRLAAVGLARLERTIGRVLSSPLKRAAETAELLAEALKGRVQVEAFDGLAPGRPFRAVLAKLSEFGPDDTTVLVGHEPDLGKLAGVLLIGAPASLPLKKAGACAVAFDGTVVSGGGRLEWFLPAKVLRRHMRRPHKARV